MNRRRFVRLAGLTATSMIGASLLPSHTVFATRSGKTVSVTLDPSLPVHPLLQYGAAVEPEKTVRVIMQRTHAAARGRDIANAVGANHLEEFGFIKADHLELKQKQVLAMAKHKDVLYVGPDSPTQKHTINTSQLQTIYPVITNATKVWNTVGATGRGITVAVLDTGITVTRDWQDQTVVHAVNVNKSSTTTTDGHGHGTHVASMINGMDGNNNYIGTAPHANVINVKIADDTGMAHEADLLRGLQWCYDNRASYGGIRIVNLSICAGTAESYKTSPVCAAAEQLWLNGVVVVAAAGNRGNAKDAVWYAPANDPYVISVGALDDLGTTDYSDDVLASFSSYGKTQDGYSKPDVIAPGRKIYGALAGPKVTLAQQMPTHITPDGKHIRLSGTSMAAPQVSGTCALLLEKYPHLTPDQLKALVISGSHGYGSTSYVHPDAAKVVNPFTSISQAGQTPLPVANQGLTPNNGIQSGSNTVAWDAAYWDATYWDTAYWDATYWDVADNYD